MLRKARIDRGMLSLTDFSEQMYKKKFAEWQIGKYLSGKNASWMINQARKRKLQDKETVFQLGSRPVSYDQIERTAKRSKTSVNDVVDASMFLEVLIICQTDSVSAPPGISYYTPSVFEPSPRGKEAPPVTGEDASRWKPEHRPDDTSRSVKMMWGDLTKADVNELLKSADRFEQTGYYKEAEEKFRTALSALQHLLPPMHGDTIDLSYRFATFYAQNDRVKDAYAILQWLTECSMHIWGREDRRTLRHLERTIEMMFTWHRITDAATLIHQLFGSNAPEAETSLLDWPSGDAESTAKMDCELTLAQFRARADPIAGNQVLLPLVDQCEENIEMYARQTLKAWSALVQLHRARHDIQPQIEVLERAASKLDDVLAQAGHNDAAMFDEASLLFQHALFAREYDLAGRISSAIEETATKSLTNHDTALMRILTKLGLQYQAANMWEEARPYFEHALAASMVGNGLSHPFTQTLEIALERQHFVEFPVMLEGAVDAQRIMAKAEQQRPFRRRKMMYVYLIRATPLAFAEPMD